MDMDWSEIGVVPSVFTAAGLTVCARPRPNNLPQPALSLPCRKLAVRTIATSVEPPKGKTGRPCSHSIRLPSR
jgi:hypothetical protein